MHYLIICIFSLIIVIFIIKRIIKNFVLKNSSRIENIRNINLEYKFHQVKTNLLKHVYDNENFYNNISTDDYLIYELQYKRKTILNDILFVDENLKLYEQYKKEISEIGDVMYSKNVSKAFLKIVNFVENKEFEKLKLSPCISYKLRVTLNLSTINGRIYNSKSKDYSSEMVCYYLNLLNDKTGKHYNNRNVWDAICRVERGKVSNKMRFAIYQRDGYRCRYCGRSDTWTDLEIDHIYPIAKGGKSTIDNLQTLCHKCNLEKGSKF